MDTKTDCGNKNCVIINIRSGEIPVLRAGWANIIILISITFVIIMNGFLKEINTYVLLRYLVISIGFILLIREYIFDISSILLFDEYIKFKCSIATFSIKYGDIQIVKLKKYSFMIASVLKIKLQSKFIYYKFNIGPSITNSMIYNQGANELKDCLIKRGIQVK